MTDPPRPEHLDDWALYTKHRLKESIRYVDATFEYGRPTPLCTPHLNLYKSACTRVLELEQATDFVKVTDAKAAWIDTIYDYETNIMVYAAITSTRDEESRALRNSIIDLHRAAFYSRYARCFVGVPLKDAVKARKKAACERLRKEHWVDVEKAIQEEKPAYRRLHRGEKFRDECCLHLSISQACSATSFGFYDTMSIIHEYATKDTYPDIDFLL